MDHKINWLASYPKSGNTWMRLVLSHLRQAGRNPPSINAIDGGGIASDRRWIDNILGFSTADLTPHEIERLRPAAYRWSAAHFASDQVHKIHDACIEIEGEEHLPAPSASGPSIYLIRNPLDIVLSYTNHLGWKVDGVIGAMNSSEHAMGVTDFPGITAQVEQRLLSWSEHVTSWIDNPQLDLLVLRYEDMLDAPHACFAKATRHLGLDYSEVELDRAVAQTQFDRLQRQENAEPFREKSKASKQFFRKGIAGDWQDSLTRAQIDRIVDAHRPVMQRFGYCDANGQPKVQ